MLRDGRMQNAGSLRPGHSLMPLYRDLFRGYEMVYQPINGHLLPTHRLADEWNLRGGVYADVAGNAPASHRLRPSEQQARPTSSGWWRASIFDCTTKRATVRTSIAQRTARRSARHWLVWPPIPLWRERFGAAQAQRALAILDGPALCAREGSSLRGAATIRATKRASGIALRR